MQKSENFCLFSLEIIFFETEYYWIMRIPLGIIWFIERTQFGKYLGLGISILWEKCSEMTYCLKNETAEND